MGLIRGAPKRFLGSNREHAHGVIRGRNMRLTSREKDLVPGALITFSFWRKSFLKLSPPGEFSSCFLVFVFLGLLEVCYLLFGDSAYMDDSIFCLRICGGLHKEALKGLLEGLM